jgi:hypothetical protein
MDRAADEYLTITELATRLKLKPKTIRNKMGSGAFRRGVHYFRPPGMEARFKWSAVVGWLEQDQMGQDDAREAIPMPRCYRRKERNSNKSITTT